MSFEKGMKRLQGEITEDTYWGISKRYFPQWIGWKVDADERHEHVERFYREYFWNPMKCDTYTPLMSEFVFVMSVRVGKRVMQKKLERSDDFKMLLLEVLDFYTYSRVSYIRYEELVGYYHRYISEGRV